MLVDLQTCLLNSTTTCFPSLKYVHACKSVSCGIGNIIITYMLQVLYSLYMTMFTSDKIYPTVLKVVRPYCKVSHNTLKTIKTVEQ